MAKGKINYTNSVYNAINKEKLQKDIIKSTQSSPELRAEIARIFQKANRRIQNIEGAGLFSPAVQALGERGEGYSKFHTGGLSWTELKIEYGKAVSFLREPTSTATGARQYNEHIRAAYDLTKDEYQLMIDNFMGKVLSVRDSDFVEKYLMRYKDFTGELETEAASLSGQIESDAYTLADRLQNNIDDTVKDVLNPALDDLMAEFAELGGNK